jgi:Kef-type K+ transport system membrane component KefB
VNGSGHGTLPHVLLAMIVVIIAARLLGAVFRRLAQPAVIGEVVAGILLGPSLLGRVAPEVSTYLLPPSVAPYLQIIAQLGVILFMFLVGLELDTSLLRKRTRATVAISHASIVLPMALGAGSAMFIHRELAPAGVPLHVFALFLGVSMSVTAFPVLARILTDRGISKTELGTLAISCAAVDDVTAWCLLAGVVGFARHDFGDALRTLALSALYVTVMLVVVRPLLARLVRRQELLGRLTPGAVALVFIGLLASALATEYAGIHALFGAFLLGAIIPHESLLAKDLKVKLEDLVVMLLLPAFFAYTGMRTQIGLLSDVWSWLVCAALIAVACAGKFGGGTLAARLTGLSWRDAASIGVLMNTRGLMELVVLNIGLDLGVISPALFAMLVVMAIVTTLATTPLLELLTRGGTGGVGARSVPSP